MFKAKKTGNMISKANERTVQFKKKQFNKDQARSGKGVSESPRRNLKTENLRGRPGTGFRARGGGQVSRGERGGLAQRPR